MTGSKAPLGLAMAFFSAGLYALTSIGAALAYGEGINPATFIWLRFGVSSLVLALAALALRKSFRIPRRGLLPLLGTGLGTLGMSNGYLTSIAFIPVSLAVMIFYTFPLLVGITEALLHRKAPSPLALACYLVAFGGLALSLGPSFETLDWRGIALAGLASLSGVVALLSSRKLAALAEPLSVAALANVISLLCMTLLLPFIGTLAWPITAVGWLLVAGACSFFFTAFALSIFAVRHASAGAVAMMYNFEPALTVIISLLFLGAALSVWQLLGVALVLGALFASSLRRA